MGTTGGREQLWATAGEAATTATARPTSATPRAELSPPARGSRGSGEEHTLPQALARFACHGRMKRATSLVLVLCIVLYDVLDILETAFRAKSADGPALSMMDLERIFKGLNSY